VIFADTDINGVKVVGLAEIRDERGFFARSWCEDEFAEQGIGGGWVQENVGFNPRPGTLRGMHLQLAPHAERKLVRCTRGAIWDVAVDLREGSSSWGRSVGVELTADNHTMLHVPEGCAHGYLTLSRDTEVRYLTSHRYAPSAATGVRHDDPMLNLTWPDRILLVSEADASWPLLGEQADHAGGPR
jgi:dTDP-4-dehydrorhamnose 3,5-epimerase